MSLTMLQLVQQHCARTNIPVPVTVYGTNNPQVRQVMALLEEEGNDLAMRGQWEGLTFQAAHVSIAAEDQGKIATIAVNGFRYIINQTIWDRSTRLPVCGPLNPRDWQALKAVLATGPRYQYRLRAGNLLVNPTPVAGENWYFEYVSQNWILDTNGTTYKAYFTADTDTFVLPDTLLLLGLRWRWMREKGLDYAELFQSYEMQVKDQFGRDGSKKPLFADCDPNRGPQPGVWIPDGSWAVP